MMLSFRMSDEELKALKRIAKDERASVSAIIVRSLLQTYPELIRARIDSVEKKVMGDKGSWTKKQKRSS